MGRHTYVLQVTCKKKKKEGGNILRKKNPPKKTEPVQKIMNDYYIKTRT